MISHYHKAKEQIWKSYELKQNKLMQHFAVSQSIALFWLFYLSMPQ